MNIQDKELLYKALCSYLPYEIRISNPNYEGDVEKLVEIQGTPQFSNWINFNTDVTEIIVDWRIGNVEKDMPKPYLRPMSNMTDEEKRIYYEYTFCREDEGYVTDKLAVEVTELNKLIDWLNAHHFDYRGLIEKGLALESPADMYND